MDDAFDELMKDSNGSPVPETAKSYVVGEPPKKQKEGEKGDDDHDDDDEHDALLDDSLVDLVLNRKEAKNVGSPAPAVHVSPSLSSLSLS